MWKEGKFQPYYGWSYPSRSETAFENVENCTIDEIDKKGKKNSKEDY